MEKYGLLGRKLGHSYSPQIHGQLASYSYSLFEKEPEELEGFLKNGDFTAINVTIPYKKTVMPYLCEISDEAKKIGSVNTVTRLSDGTLYGDNTDYYGFSYMLSIASASLRVISSKRLNVLPSLSMTSSNIAFGRTQIPFSPYMA